MNVLFKCLNIVFSFLKKQKQSPLQLKPLAMNVMIGMEILFVINDENVYHCNFIFKNLKNIKRTRQLPFKAHQGGPQHDATHTTLM